MDREAEEAHPRGGDDDALLAVDCAPVLVPFGVLVCADAQLPHLSRGLRV